MSAPEIFVSSPMEDLKVVREEVSQFVQSLGYNVSWWERGSIAHDPYGGGVISSAIYGAGKADVVILMLAERYGSVPNDGDERSVTEREYDEARQNRVPVYAFVIASTLAEYKDAFSRNRGNTGVIYRVETKLLKFIDRLYEDVGPGQTVITSFTFPCDIIGFLKNQWALLFGEYLRTRKAARLASLPQQEAKELNLTEDALRALESNRLMVFMLEGARNAGKVSLDFLSLVSCLQRSRDLQSFCHEIHGKTGYKPRIDRVLISKANAEYERARRVIAAHPPDGFDLYNLA